MPSFVRLTCGNCRTPGLVSRCVGERWSRGRGHGRARWTDPGHRGGDRRRLCLPAGPARRPRARRPADRGGEDAGVAARRPGGERVGRLQGAARRRPGRRPLRRARPAPRLARCRRAGVGARRGRRAAARGERVLPRRAGAGAQLHADRRDGADRALPHPRREAAVRLGRAGRRPDRPIPRAGLRRGAGLAGAEHRPPSGRRGGGRGPAPGRRAVGPEVAEVPPPRADPARPVRLRAPPQAGRAFGRRHRARGRGRHGRATCLPAGTHGGGRPGCRRRPGACRQARR